MSDAVIDRPRMLARIIVCYLVSVLSMGTLGHVTQPEPGPLILLVLLAAVFGIPFLLAVLVVAYVWARSILRRPFAWGIVIPVLVSTLAGLVFMALEGAEAAILSTYLAAICAFIGSLCFLLWLYISPLIEADEQL